MITNFLRRVRHGWKRNSEERPDEPPVVDLDSATTEEDEDRGVTASPFPCRDELGRLICKACGLPYKSWHLRSLLQDGIDIELCVCVSCGNVSSFSPGEILRGHYLPKKFVGSFLGREAPAIPLPVPVLSRKVPSLRDETGHLKCQSCGAPSSGFTVRGALALLGQMEQPRLWIACESCHQILTYSADELRDALPEEVAPELRRGDELLGHRIRTVLRGGMSTVYICQGPSGLVAAKTLSPALAGRPNAEARFRREAEAWILLGRHPHIVEARLLATYQGRSVLFTEFQPGGDLAQRLASGALSLEEGISYGTQIARGMEYAATCLPGLVHRDIKPHNCLFGSDGLLKVADFGIVKLLDGLDPLPHDSEVTSQGLPVFQTRVGVAGLGTLPYMAPEQFDDFARVNVRADIYAFGVMFFEMLSGCLPILPKDTGDYRTWRIAHRTAIKPDIRRYRSEVPPRIANLLNACLATDPAERPPDFSVVLDVLETTHIIRHPEASLAPPDTLEELDMLRVFNLQGVGRLEEALAYANHIVRVASAAAAPGSTAILARGHAFRAKVYSAMSDSLRAVEAADTALAINPDDPLALLTRGCLYIELGKLENAIRCLEKSWQIDPDRRSLAVKLGFAHNALGNYERALEVLMPAIERQPEDHWLHREIAFSYLQTGDLNLAKRHYVRALALCPVELPAERAEILTNLGNAYLDEGNEKRAAELQRQAWLLAPKTPRFTTPLPPTSSTLIVQFEFGRMRAANEKLGYFYKLRQ